MQRNKFILKRDTIKKIGSRRGSVNIVFNALKKLSIFRGVISRRETASARCSLMTEVLKTAGIYLYQRYLNYSLCIDVKSRKINRLS